MFSGGISNVTRQYDGKRRSSRICSVVNVLSVWFMVCTPDLLVEGATRTRLQSCEPLRQAGQIFEIGEEITVIQEKSFNGTLEDQDLDLFVSLNGRDDPSKLADPPIGG
jgi:hypothetical protein